MDRIIKDEPKGNNVTKDFINKWKSQNCATCSNSKDGFCWVLFETKHEQKERLATVARRYLKQGKLSCGLKNRTIHFRSEPHGNRTD